MFCLRARARARAREGVRCPEFNKIRIESNKIRIEFNPNLIRFNPNLIRISIIEIETTPIPMIQNGSSVSGSLNGSSFRYYVPKTRYTNPMTLALHVQKKHKNTIIMLSTADGAFSIHPPVGNHEEWAHALVHRSMDLLSYLWGRPDDGSFTRNDNCLSPVTSIRLSYLILHRGSVDY